jgi:hypothetical protein
MSGVLFGGRSNAAKSWLLLWIAVEVGLGAVAFAGVPWGVVRNGQWQNKDFFVLLILLLLVGVAIPMHNTRASALGFRFLHGINGAKHRMDETPMNGFLTNLSIRAAITTFLLVALFQAQNTYKIVPDRTDPQFLRWDAIWASPRAFMFVLVAGALGLSLITTMAALLCTDYSLRFEWPDRTDADKQPNRVKLALRRKAHQFHVIGFYCLMWSLAAATALLDYFVCLATTMAVFLAMWSYYFFPEGVEYSTVPNLRNLSARDAESALERAGLIGKGTVVTSETAPNRVVRQDREPGTEVVPGSAVGFEVSGPPPSSSAGSS